MADSENTRSLPVARRFLLGGATALVCVRPVPACPSPAAANPDAALIAAAAQVRRTIAEENAQPSLTGYRWDSPEVLASEADLLAIVRRRSAAIEAATRIPARTQAGLRAKADIAQMHLPYALEDALDEDHETIILIASLLQDILRGVA